MSSNDIRLPQAAVLANGQYIAGVTAIEVSSNSFLGADRYRATFSLTSSGYQVWSSNSIDLDIQLAVDGDWNSLIVGPVDKIDVDIGCGLIHVDGRDLSARFQEARTQETFENQTASDIASLLASRRGLAANVVPTTELVGRYFGGSHSGISLDQHSTVTTEWDLLVRLAEHVGYDVWVQGESLNFAPPSSQASPLLLTPEQCKTLRLERLTALSGGLQVVVKSWDCRSGLTISQNASMQSRGGGVLRDYIIIRPNLTASAAAALAQRTLIQMTQSARVILFELPGDLVMQPRQMVMLAETNTDFDGAYVITSVERHVSFQHGFTQTVEARIPPWTIF